VRARAFIIVIVIWGGAGKGELYNFHYYNIYTYYECSCAAKGCASFLLQQRSDRDAAVVAGVARGPVRHGPVDLTPAVLRTSPPRTMA